jgi:hypothetical protein
MHIRCRGRGHARLSRPGRDGSTRRQAADGPAASGPHAPQRGRGHHKLPGSWYLWHVRRGSQVGGCQASRQRCTRCRAAWQAQHWFWRAGRRQSVTSCQCMSLRALQGRRRACGMDDGGAAAAQLPTAQAAQQPALAAGLPGAAPQASTRLPTHVRPARGVCARRRCLESTAAGVLRRANVCVNVGDPHPPADHLRGRPLSDQVQRLLGPGQRAAARPGVATHAHCDAAGRPGVRA